MKWQLAFLFLVLVGSGACWEVHLYVVDPMFKMVLESRFWFDHLREALFPNSLVMHIDYYKQKKPEPFKFPAIILGSHRKVRGFVEREREARKTLPVYYNDSIVQTERAFGIFLFGDEEYRAETKSQLTQTVYPHSMFIIRNYYYDSLFKDEELASRMVYMPNGYRNELSKVCEGPLKPIAEKKLFMSFRGGRKPQRAREEAVRIATEIADRHNKKTHFEFTHAFGKGLAPAAFGKELKDSVFSLCPRGNSNETIRLYDAIQCHSIPVVLRGSQFMNYLEDKYGNLPFPVFDSWDEIEKLAVMDNRLIELMRQETRMWMRTFEADLVEELQKKVRNRLQKYFDLSLERGVWNDGI